MPPKQYEIRLDPLSERRQFERDDWDKTVRRLARRKPRKPSGAKRVRVE